MELPIKGQVVKTKSGNKTWRVLRLVDNEVLLQGVTNLKLKKLSIDQFQKTWKIV